MREWTQTPRLVMHGPDARGLHARLLTGYTDLADDEASGAALGSPLPLTFTVDSGGGLHVYWVFDKPLADLAQFTAIQRGIVQHFGSDSIVDPARVLRLAGTFNFKQKMPVPTKVS